MLTYLKREFNDLNNFLNSGGMFSAVSKAVASRDDTRGEKGLWVLAYILLSLVSPLFLILWEIIPNLPIIKNIIFWNNERVNRVDHFCALSGTTLLTKILLLPFKLLYLLAYSGFFRPIVKPMGDSLKTLFYRCKIKWKELVESFHAIDKKPPIMTSSGLSVNAGSFDDQCISNHPDERPRQLSQIQLVENTPPLSVSTEDWDELSTYLNREGEKGEILYNINRLVDGLVNVANSDAKAEALSNELAANLIQLQAFITDNDIHNLTPTIQAIIKWAEESDPKAPCHTMN